MLKSHKLVSCSTRPSAGHSRLRHQREVALFAADARPLTINLLPIRFQDHAQGIAHYLQTPRIGYYSIDLTGVPQGVQAVQVCHPLDIVDYGSEWSSVLLLGNAQLLRYGLENIGLGGNDRVLFRRCWGSVAEALLEAVSGAVLRAAPEALPGAFRQFLRHHFWHHFWHHFRHLFRHLFWPSFPGALEADCLGISAPLGVIR